MRAAPMVIILILLLPQAAAGQTVVADPAGDEVASVLYVQGQPVRTPEAMGCHDTRADILSLWIASDAEYLSVTMQLSSLSGAPACEIGPELTPHLEGWSTILTRQSGNGFALHLTTPSNPCRIYAYGNQPGAGGVACLSEIVGDTVVWTIPLKGTFNTGWAAHAPYDLRGADYDVYGHAFTSTSMACPFTYCTWMRFEDTVTTPLAL